MAAASYGTIAAGVIGAVLGLLPFILLFVDCRKRGQIHKPFIYLAVFGLTFAVMLPFLLKAFGLWLALIAPFAILGVVRASGIRRPRTSSCTDMAGRFGIVM